MEINNMLQVVVVGDNGFASCMELSVNMISGIIKHNVHFIDYQESMDSYALYLQVLKHLGALHKAELLIILDSIEGAAYKEAIKIREYHIAKVGILIGANLATILSLMFTENNPLEEALEIGKKAGIEGIITT
jgi:mannose/fructose-specific phosphotransferase system component IIA